MLELLEIEWRRNQLCDIFVRVLEMNHMRVVQRMLAAITFSVDKYYYYIFLGVCRLTIN